ncbi:hypothetical protein IWX48DRAFT_174335 [Phyllosticta citricarpa]
MSIKSLCRVVGADRPQGRPRATAGQLTGRVSVTAQDSRYLSHSQYGRQGIITTTTTVLLSCKRQASSPSSQCSQRETLPTSPMTRTDGKLGIPATWIPRPPRLSLSLTTPTSSAPLPPIFSLPYCIQISIMDAQPGCLSLYLACLLSTTNSCCVRICLPAVPNSIASSRLFLTIISICTAGARLFLKPTRNADCRQTQLLQPQ